MSSLLEETTLKSVLDALRTGDPALIPTTREIIDHAQEARNRTISVCMTTSDAILITLALDAAIGMAVCAVAAPKPFFTIPDLCKRYSKSRKWVERLPIRRHKMEGAILYSLGDVLAYEGRSAEDPPSKS